MRAQTLPSLARNPAVVPLKPAGDCAVRSQTLPSCSLCSPAYHVVAALPAPRGRHVSTLNVALRHHRLTSAIAEHHQGVSEGNCPWINSVVELVACWQECWFHAVFVACRWTT